MESEGIKTAEWDAARTGASPILLPYQHRWVGDRRPLKIWLASRQVGKSFALSFEAVNEALKKKCDNLLLSASERQSKELMRKVLSHLRCLNVLTEAEATNAEDRTQEEIRLPGGSRIMSLPASPDTVRGFSGNVFLDEFAFHRDAREIWRSMYPAVTRGYKVRISSTPNGKQNMFYELWAGAACRDYLDGGSAPSPPLRDKVPQTPVWSRHRTDIYDAVKEGLNADIAALRAGVLDADSWAQEFECRFVDEATAFITYEMIAGCEEDIPLCGGSGAFGPRWGSRGRSPIRILPRLGYRQEA